jgi:hypothetical protein
MSSIIGQRSPVLGGTDNFAGMVALAAGQVVAAVAK